MADGVLSICSKVSEASQMKTNAVDQTCELLK